MFNGVYPLVISAKLACTELLMLVPQIMLDPAEPILASTYSLVAN